MAYAHDFPWHTASAAPFRACGVGAMQSKIKIDAIDLRRFGQACSMVSLGVNLALTLVLE